MLLSYGYDGLVLVKKCSAKSLPQSNLFEHEGLKCSSTANQRAIEFCDGRHSVTGDVIMKRRRGGEEGGAGGVANGMFTPTGERGIENHQLSWEAS